MRPRCESRNVDVQETPQTLRGNETSAWLTMSQLPWHPFTTFKCFRTPHLSSAVSLGSGYRQSGQRRWVSRRSDTPLHVVEKVRQERDRKSNEGRRGGRAHVSAESRGAERSALIAYHNYYRPEGSQGVFLPNSIPGRVEISLRISLGISPTGAQSTNLLTNLPTNLPKSPYESPRISGPQTLIITLFRRASETRLVCVRPGFPSVFCIFQR